MFCKYCGNKAEDNQTFCSVCGKKIIEEKESSQKTYDGRLKKCPNCGELVDSFTAKCKACGYEFRDTSGVSSIKELRKSLEEINNKEEADYWTPQLGIVGQRTSRMVEAIKSFNIPNTKEDIIELMIMASSNIVIDSSLHIMDLRRPNCNAEALTDAWKAKLEQAYQKAKMTLSDDPSFARISNIYSSKMDEIEKAKKKRIIEKVISIALPILMILFGVILIRL